LLLHREKCYENGDFHKWQAGSSHNPGKYVKTTREDLKPGRIFRQHLNDAINSRYISEHKIGLLTVNGKKVSNCFYTPNIKDSERTWNFPNDAYWA